MAAPATHGWSLHRRSAQDEHCNARPPLVAAGATAAALVAGSRRRAPAQVDSYWDCLDPPDVTVDGAELTAEETS